MGMAINLMTNCDGSRYYHPYYRDDETVNGPSRGWCDLIQTDRLWYYDCYQLIRVVTTIWALSLRNDSATTIQLIFPCAHNLLKR